jgi:hypothetical protein
MHVFPRALMLDLRSTGKHLFEGNSGRVGVRFSQNGAWDDRVLCKDHEDVCGAGDEYAIELSRRLTRDAIRTPTGAYSIRNPRPDLLVRFVYATVWKRVISADGRSCNLSLGTFRQTIEEHLFRNGAATLPAIVARANLVSSDGSAAAVAIPPYRQRLGNWNVWHFQVGGLDMYLKTDRRPFPAHFTPYLANDNDPLVLLQIDPLRLDRVPILRPAIQQMFAPHIAQHRGEHP